MILKNCITFLLSVITITGIILPRTTVAGPAERKQFTILYTVNNYGYIEPCG